MEVNIISDTILVNRDTTNLLSSTGESYRRNRVLASFDIMNLGGGQVRQERKQWKWEVIDASEKTHILTLQLANTNGKVKYTLDDQPIKFIAEVYKHEGVDTQVRTLDYAHTKSIYRFDLILGYCLLIVASVMMGALIAVTKDALGVDASKVVMLIVATVQAGFTVAVYFFMIKFIMQADAMRDKFKAWENTQK